MTTDSKENTEALLKMACQEAERGVESDDGGPFGALVVKNGRILAIGHNEGGGCARPLESGWLRAVHKLEEDAAAAGFRDKAFYDLLSDSSSLNAYMEHVPVVGMENAMQMWINKENKEQY
ncbi:Guanosine deaminase [Trichinella pseudospiralis]